MDKSTFRCLANLKEIRLEKLAKGFFCENDNFEGVSIQRREARDEVHVQIYKASKEEGCYVKWDNDSFWSYEVKANNWLFLGRP